VAASITPPEAPRDRPGDLASYRAPLDHFSEYAMSVESDEYPKSDWTQMQFRGPIDYAAIAESFDDALMRVPVFNCNLAERHRGIFYEPYWYFNTHVKNRLVIEDCRHMATPPDSPGAPFDPLEFSTRFHAERTRRRIDPTREFPFRCYLVRVSDDEHIFSIFFHHSVMDPFKAYKVITRMFAGYHQRVKGARPAWADKLGMAMLERKGGYVKPLSAVTFAREQLADVLIKNTSSKVAMIKTRRVLPPAEMMGRISRRATFDDPKILEGVLSRASKNEATLNDIIFACARRVLSQWNEERGASAERMRFMLITSLTGRMELGDNTGAGLSGLNFVSIGHEKSDLDTIIRFFRDTRRDQLQRGVDIAFYHSMRRIVQSMRVFPLHIRRNFVRPIIERIPCTFYLSNLGTVWPKIVDGRQTLESEIVDVGDFSISDMHSSASIARNLGLGLTVRAHNNRFYMNFVCDRFRFEPDEATDICNRIVNEIVSAAG
ncbi:hypothetical protein K8I61_15585, partial [bacterium]|nr:hypothetical protein [bacterium]